jgi:molybdenum cofactor cytidylyltransferase
LIGTPDGKGRVAGPSPELIGTLHDRSTAEVILVEADGSRSRPFKAPGVHEPVVPPSTTILVPVVGLNAIGQSLSEDHAHRAEMISFLAEQPLGTPVTNSTVARILSHPRGGAKDLPSGARLVPLLNKADTDSALANGRAIAEMLLKSRDVDSVILSAMTQNPPVREAWTPVAGIILAAGMSTRFGRTKQTSAWGDTNLAAHSARTALAAGLDPVIVVLGSDVANVKKAVSGLPVHFVFNPEFAAGQSSSIRRGLDALPPRTGAALFILADQPLVTPEIMRSIVEAHRQTFAQACVPVYGGRRGNPVLFDKTLFEELRRLSGDTGGRVLLEKYPEKVVSIPASRAVVMDIDTPEDYEMQRNL